MIIYISIFIFLAFMSFVELFTVRNRKMMQIAMGIVLFFLVILTSIRGGTRGDYITYKEVYTYMTDTTSFFSVSNFMFEPLYSCLQWLCKGVVNNFQFFLFVIGTLVIILQHMYAMQFEITGWKQADGSAVVHNVKNAGQYYFTIMFMFWGLYYGNIFVIRSTIATMICLYGIKYIEERQKIKFCCFVAIAVGFHYSALIFLPAYFIYHFHSKLSTKIMILLGGTIFLSLSIGLFASIFGRIVGGSLGQKIALYLASNDFLNGTGLANGFLLIMRALLNMSVLLISALYLWKFNKNDRNYEGYLNLYLTGCVLYIATLTIGYAFARISIYYNIFQIPMMMYLFKVCSKTDQKFIYWLIFSAYLFVRFISNTYAGSYITFWQ